MSFLPPDAQKGIGNNKTLELLIAKAFLEAEKTCSSPSVLSFATILPGTSITFHELITILGAIVCIFNCICALYLGQGHILHWVKPEEQRQILRIIIFVPVISIASFFSIYFYVAEGIIHPVAVWYEALAMNAIFLLYVVYVCPNPGDRAQYFSDLPRLWYNGKPKGTGGSLRWFRIIWICVFQIFFTRIATVVAQEVLLGLTCPLSPARRTGTTAIQVIQGVSTSTVIYAVITFEKRMRFQLQHHSAMLKLVSFKAIVGLEAVQDILFSALGETGVYFPKPPYRLSWVDFSRGIPEFLLLCEMAIVAVAFLWSFTFEPYREAVVRGENIKSSSWKALFSAFDLSDIWNSVVYMFTCFTSSTFLEGRVDGRVIENYVPAATRESSILKVDGQEDKRAA